MAYGNVNVDTVTTSTTGGVLGAGNASIMKNRLINGAMLIDQRLNGTSYSVPSGNNYNVDRWQTYAGVSSKFTVQQNSGNAPATQGFSQCLKVTSSSAYSVPAGGVYTFQQMIEGYNVQDLAWGTASAKTVTLSFWVNCSLTGTFGGALYNNAGDRCYVFSYTVIAANTWEYKTITIAGPTDGTWLTNSGIGLAVSFSLGMGSNYLAAAGSWYSSAKYSVSGGVDLVATNGATWYLTGVQLEVGSSATGYEFVNQQTLLANCQRYYMTKSMWVNGNAYTNNSRMSSGIDYPVEMRAAPTATITASTSTNCNTPIMFNGTTNRYSIYVNSVGSSTDMTFTATVTFSAEL